MTPEKKNKTKKASTVTGDVTQVVDQKPCMDEALGSILISGGKKKLNVLLFLDSLFAESHLEFEIEEAVSGVRSLLDD